MRWAALIPAGGAVLDVACGSGRHATWLAAQGFRVTGVDRDAAALQALRDADARIDTVSADIENGPWPFAGRHFDAVVITNYLWRPLMPTLVAAVANGGVFIHETFAAGNASVGKPSNPDFLLRPMELLQAAAGLRVVAFEDGFLDAPARCVQRIAAVRETTGERPAGTPAQGPSPRYPL